MTDKQPPITITNIETKILFIRGQKVMLDSDLAELYGVEIRALNQAVKRNAERFPQDFMFQLTPEEHESLRSQFVTLKAGRGQHRKYAPYVFTEHGALMLGNVLKSERAVEVSIMVVRTFVHLRELVSSNNELSLKLDKLERKFAGHDRAISELINTLRQLMSPSVSDKKRPIGFAPWDKNETKQTNK
ncbi:MAG: ORF6N domain-containing protein [Sideroxydans sp.]|nr:ORF6N domain-containing protein [Sideroxydans sp.]